MAAKHIPAIADESFRELNAAIASTEDEILRDAMGEDPLENDGDRQLEEMPESVLDEDIEDEDEDAEAEEGEEEADEEGADEEDEESEDDEGEEDANDRQQAARGREDQDRGRVPPHRVREETERRRAAETALAERDQRIAMLEQRFNDMLMSQAQTRQAPPPPPTAQQVADAARPAPPDMFADPAGYQNWVRTEVQREAAEQARAIVTQQMQELSNNRVNQSLHAAATGDRAWEFQAAYQALTTTLDPRNPQHRQIVQGVYNASDPQAALWAWWDANGGPAYREQVFSRLAPQFETQPRRDDRGARNGQADNRGSRGYSQGNGGRPQVRFEGPRQVRTGPPSLNSASRAGSQSERDPDMFDGSEESIMNYAFR